jgi:hypothetical protein
MAPSLPERTFGWDPDVEGDAGGAGGGAGARCQKLRWFQMGGGVSDRQWRDIQGIIRTQEPALDRGYLRRWTAAPGVSAELERALTEAE